MSFTVPLGSSGVYSVSKARVVSGDAIAFLSGKSEPFDIALLDPPYRKGLLP